ncbi:MAG TPA: Ig-like domain-containing protein [Tepidisphaeraceae bacterium]|nr:Ig-like domain-containing protein [Tepidisphaeraceae bacterium]
MSGGEAPAVEVTTPSQPTTARGPVEIAYRASDDDSAASVALYYDTDGQGYDGIKLADGLAESENGAFLWDTSGLPDGNYYIYAVASDNEMAPVSSRYAAGRVIVGTPPMVVGRRILYNGSAYDGRNGNANALDDGAVATDRRAWTAGKTATASSVTSYVHGINGIFIDVDRLTGAPRADDFMFHVGTGSDPSKWIAAPAPSTVTVRYGAGVAGSDRVTITWANGAIRNTWLQVTVLPVRRTGLAEADVFYFGNLVGETGEGGGWPSVTAVDLLRTRLAMFSSTSIDSRYDFNRDGRVTVLDFAIARSAVAQRRSLSPLIAAVAPAMAAAPPRVLSWTGMPAKKEEARLLA